MNQIHHCYFSQGLISSWKAFVPNTAGFFPGNGFTHLVFKCILSHVLRVSGHRCNCALDKRSLSWNISPRATRRTGQISYEKGSESPHSHYQQLSSWPEDKWKAVHKTGVINEEQQKGRYHKYYEKDHICRKDTYATQMS